MQKPNPTIFRAAAGRWLLAVMALAAPLVIALLVFYMQDRAHERALVGQRVEDALELAAGKIEREMSSVTSDLLYLTRQAALQRFFADLPDSKQELQQEYLRFAEEKASYDQIRLLDLQGNEIVRINYQAGSPAIVPDAELQPKSSRYYFQQAAELKPGEVFVSPMDLNEEHGEIQTPHKPVIRFVTPVFQNQQQKQGYLVLNYLGQNLLTEFVDATRGLPGQQFVANSRGEFLYSPNPQENWGWLLGHSHSLPTRFPDFWPIAGQQGQLAHTHGVFSHIRINFGTAEHLEPEQLPDDESGAHDASLELVSFVNWEEIDSRSSLLLQRLLAISAGAIVLLGIIAGYWAHASTVHKQQGELLAASETRLRTLSRQLLHAQEDERRRISRDLHDDLSQQITAICLNLRSANQQPATEKSNELLTQTVEGAEQLLSAVHRIAGNLRPSALDDISLTAALESLISEMESVFPIEFKYRAQGLDEDALGHEAKENAFRIIQEGLSNAAKHAQCQRVELDVEQRDGLLTIDISDDGQGFVVEQADGTRLGLLGMRERAELLGGTFQLQSKPGSGTTISVEIPALDASNS